jgi:hypothetical protein
VKSVTLSEFRERLDAYLLRGESVCIEHDGRTLGYFLPARHASEEETRELLDRMNSLMQAVYEETGLDEEGFIEALGLKAKA